MADFRYTESGLDNVIIKGLPVVQDDAGEAVYAIPNILGLHKVLAYCLITREHGLSPAEFRFLRTEMGLTQAQLAAVVKKDHQTIGRWERGETAIDQNAEAVIRILAAEKLDIDVQMRVEEIVSRCMPSADFQEIRIDGSDPDNYMPCAA